MPRIPGSRCAGLAKIASGGELSRIMLALKSIFAAMDPVPVLIFDEVDTGVSGRAAQAIAEKMAWLAGHARCLPLHIFRKWPVWRMPIMRLKSRCEGERHLLR